MKKVITAITLGVICIVTFGIGVACIVRGAGDFSWDIVSKYISESDTVDIGNYFSANDHSQIVDSHAEGKIQCPTNGGEIKIEDIPTNAIIETSADEYIHVTFDGKIRESCVVKSADNLTGTNIPNLEFKYNQSDNKAVIRFNKLRTLNNSNSQLTISIPNTFNGELDFSDIAGKVEGDAAFSLTELSAEDVAGKVSLSKISANELDISNIAGNIVMDDGSFNIVEVSDAAGNVSVSGRVGWFEISDIMGEVTVESSSAIAGNCEVSDIMGNVNINLPSGSDVNVNKSAVMGKVSVNNSSTSAQYTIKVESIMGKVSINN